MMGEVSVPRQIAGYHVLSLTLPRLPSYPVTATHYLYISPHQPKISTPSASRSLFLVNIPFDSTVAHFKHLFSEQIGLPAGRIEDVQFHDDHVHGEKAAVEKTAAVSGLSKGKKRKRELAELDLENLADVQLPSIWDRNLRTNNLTAVVVFVDKTSAESALKAVKRAQRAKDHPTWGHGVEKSLAPLGLARYQNNHRLTYPPKANLLRSVDKYMTAYAAKEAALAKLQAQRRSEPDEDGFVTVTRGGRNNPAKQAAAQEMAEKQKEKDKAKGLADFYRFQSREKQKEKAKELVRKFEEDKEKIRIMKNKRQRFMPE